MRAFDLHTAVLLVGLLYLVLPAFTWVVLGEGRNRAAALWCGGGLSMGVGIALVGAFEGSRNALMALSFPAALLTLSYVLRVQSLRLDLGKPWKARHLAAFWLVSIALFEVLHRGLGLYVPRAAFGSLLWLTGSIMLWAYARQIARREHSRSALWIALAYGAVSFAFGLRLFNLLQTDLSLEHGGISLDGRVAKAMAVVMLLSAVIGHLGYIGLALERVQRLVVRTLTEQARSEESQRLGAQIALLERRHSMGELAASIGHELTQPLTAILTNSQLAQRGLRTGRLDSAGAQTLLGKIEHNTARASQILERIRNFMRPGDAARGAVDLHSVVQDVVELVDGAARSSGTQIHLGPQRGPARVLGDAIELSQVVLNLLTNAMESMADTPEPRILIECWQADGRVCLQVRDWGKGLDAQGLSQAGSAFYTTKAQGMGMGLSIARALAHQHGGTLTLKNANDGRGVGALAVLELPALADGVPA